MILDQWLSYLRHGLHTCYYCVASMSFAEELHRKCIAHIRPNSSVKPEATTNGADAQAPDDSKPSADEKPELKTEENPEKADANGEQDEKPNAEEEDTERRDGEATADAEKPSIGARERERTKTSGFGQKTSDERWEESLDHKLMAMLAEVDATEYGGRDIEE